MRLHFRKRYFTRITSFIVFIVFTLCIIIYLPCNIYDFPASKKFTGEFLYNPYQQSSVAWQKTNFHAHAVAWHGITNGSQSAQAVIQAYQQKGYACSCISNYENIAAEDNDAHSLNVYEHGYNIRKIHQLVILPQKVDYSDFPLWQFASSRQFVINRLSASAKAIVLAHPKLKNSYSNEDLKKLSGYNLMEVLNHAGNASSKWDIALSGGRPVWIVGDDDTHNILDSTQTFNNWTMINCRGQNKDSLVEHLISGDAYAVNGRNAVNNNGLLNVKVSNMNITICLQQNADSIQLIGQNGVKRKVFLNSATASYMFLDTDTYIRAVVYNKASTMYLNPIVRFDGKTTPQNVLTATINFTNTTLYRGFLLVCWLIVCIVLNPAIVKFLIKLRERKLPPGRISGGLVLEIE